MQCKFAASAECHLERRNDDGLCGIAQAHGSVLEGADGHVYVLPILFLRFQKQQHQVGANREIDTLVSDDHSYEILFDLGKRLFHHLDGVGADGVHL